MKTTLRKVFSFILTPLEQGDSEYAYQPSHRKILMVMGVLFTILAGSALFAAAYAQLWGGLLPALVFLSVGIVCASVAFLGTDKAVARIWKSK